MRLNYWVFAFTVLAIAIILAIAFFALNNGQKETAAYEKNENATAENSIVKSQGVAAACNEGKREGCSIDACAGEKICIRGEWSDCLLLPKVCVPNSTSACPYDNCRFGKAKCNSCGNGYGKCELVQCEANEKCEKQ